MDFSGHFKVLIPFLICHASSTYTSLEGISDDNMGGNLTAFADSQNITTDTFALPSNVSSSSSTTLIHTTSASGLSNSTKSDNNGLSLPTGFISEIGTSKQGKAEIFCEECNITLHENYTGDNSGDRIAKLEIQTTSVDVVHRIGLWPYLKMRLALMDWRIPNLNVSNNTSIFDHGTRGKGLNSIQPVPVNSTENIYIANWRTLNNSGIGNNGSQKGRPQNNQSQVIKDSMVINEVEDITNSSGTWSLLHIWKQRWTRTNNSREKDAKGKSSFYVNWRANTTHVQWWTYIFEIAERSNNTGAMKFMVELAEKRFSYLDVIVGALTIVGVVSMVMMSTCLIKHFLLKTRKKLTVSRANDASHPRQVPYTSEANHVPISNMDTLYIRRCRRPNSLYLPWTPVPVRCGDAKAKGSLSSDRSGPSSLSSSSRSGKNNVTTESDLPDDSVSNTSASDSTGFVYIHAYSEGMQ